MNTHPDGTPGFLYLPTKAKEENYPLRSGFKSVGYYGLEFIGIKKLDEAIVIWFTPGASAVDKTKVTFAAIMAGFGGKEGEGGMGEGEGGGMSSGERQPTRGENLPSNENTSSPNVQKTLDMLNEIENEGGTIKPNQLNPNQEINYTIQFGTEKIDVRIETHPLPPKYGSDNVTPTRHMNVDLNPGKSRSLLNKDHKILTDGN